jgi:hypothetical protein
MNDLSMELAAWILCIAVILACSFYVQVRRMANAAVLPHPELAPAFQASLPTKARAFLEENRFVFDGAYIFQNVRFAVWTQPVALLPVRRFVLMQAAGKLAHDFVTEFSELESLTTGMSRANFLFPRPWGSFLQSFPGKSLRELWQQHTQGETFLIESGAVLPNGASQSIEATLAKAMPRQMAHVRSFPLWPVRALYWYFIKRFLSQNIPISAQNLARSYRK